MSRARRKYKFGRVAPYRGLILVGRNGSRARAIDAWIVAEYERVTGKSAALVNVKCARVDRLNAARFAGREAVAA